MPAASVHTLHHLILVYQSPFFARVKRPATTATAACFPLKNTLFILSGDGAFPLRSIVFSLTHAPLIIPLTDQTAIVPCVVFVRACVWQMCVIPSEPLKEIFQADFTLLLHVLFPTPAYLFPNPQTPTALM